VDKKLVLIVDDEEDTVEYLSFILESLGLEVISSREGLPALKLAEERKPQLIILDVNLPDIDGGEVAYRLSQREETQNIPIIYLTGLITPEEKGDSLRTGKYFVLAKPVLKGELISLVSQILGETKS